MYKRHGVAASNFKVDFDVFENIFIFETHFWSNYE